MARVLLPIALLLTTFSAAVFAQSPPAKFATCTGCHGPQTQGGNGTFPRLAGQPADYLYRQLESFKSGVRKNALMSPMASQLDTADMHQLASYISGLHPAYAAQTAGKPDQTQLARGRELVTVGDWQHGVPACASCHAPDLAGVAPDVPALAGQPVQYLHAALKRLQQTSDHSLAADTMKKISNGLSDKGIDAVTAYIGTVKTGEKTAAVRPAFDKAYKPVAQSSDTFTPPPLNAIPGGPDGDAIWQGLQIMEHTRTLAPKYVGNDLNCVNCHINQGREGSSAPMWAAYVMYPHYRSKNHQINTIEARVQGCFRFSMNGTPPPADSPEMTALVTYFHWLATGLPVGIKPEHSGYPKLAEPARKPSVTRGGEVYANNCAMCHGADGQGRRARDAGIFPPLWGPRSYNDGAGMHNRSNAAAFIHANMPYGGGRQLTVQEAWDVATFVDSQPRPPDPRKTK
ncbi:MAG TPA: c-type cytochrome [Gammaproteobacteria bacterium]